MFLGNGPSDGSSMEEKKKKKTKKPVSEQSFIERLFSWLFLSSRKRQIDNHEGRRENTKPKAQKHAQAG